MYKLCIRGTNDEKNFLYTFSGALDALDKIVDTKIRRYIRPLIN